jgi:predicted alpha/beta superfamily hydrolase
MRNRLPLVSILLAFFSIAALAEENPCKPTVTGHLDVFPIVSATFHNTRNLRVWLPPGYDDPANATKKYPVLYLLDGDSLFDACTAYLHEELHIDETLTTLITSGKIPPLIAVGVDNGSDVIDQNSDRPKSDNGNGRAIEYMPYPGTAFLPALRDVRGAQLPDFLEHDVMPAVAAKYRVLSGGKNAALWGASLSGAAALYIAIERPELFDRMIIESPSMFVGNGRLLRDSGSLTNAPHRIALGIGTEEALDSQFPDATTINAGWVRMMYSLADNLRATAYSPTQVQLTVAKGAHHGGAEFGKRFAAGLLFIYGPEPTRPSNGK